MNKKVGKIKPLEEKFIEYLMRINNANEWGSFNLICSWAS